MQPRPPAPAPLRGLYALTPDGVEDATLLAQVAAAVDGGVRFLQYRNKQADDAQRRRQAATLADYCKKREVHLIINDSVQLAQEVGADGVHLGAADVAVSDARAQLGAQAIIGCTCHGSLTRAQHAAASGASYLAFGALFPSATKPQAAPCPLSVLTSAKQQFRLPVVAIGGITPENAAAVLQAGADALAVLHGLFAAPDVSARARAFCALFPPQ